MNHQFIDLIPLLTIAPWHHYRLLGKLAVTFLRQLPACWRTWRAASQTPAATAPVPVPLIQVRGCTIHIYLNSGPEILPPGR